MLQHNEIVQCYHDILFVIIQQRNTTAHNKEIYAG